HQFPKMPPPLPPLPIRFPLASPQRFRIHSQPVFTRQMFRRQCRPKPLSLPFPVLLPHQLHHPPTKLHRLGSRPRSSRSAMPQPFGPFLPIPLPQPLGLPVTHATRLAASTTFNSLLFTRANTSTRCNSLWLIPILPIRPPSEAVH